MTDDKRLSKAERKQLQVEHMRIAERAVQIIKLADHCSNIATLPASWPLQRKIEYLNWSEEVAEACAGVNASLEGEYRQRLERARRFGSGA